jgi:ADP-ribose pyrophosphatase
VPGEDIVVHRVPLDDIAGYVESKRAEGFMIDVKMLLLLGPGLLGLTGA